MKNIICKSDSRWVCYYKKESEETIQYINKYINGEKFIIDMCEKHEYLMYTKQEMENMEKECVQFITEFLKRIKI